MIDKKLERMDDRTAKYKEDMETLLERIMLPYTTAKAWGLPLRFQDCFQFLEIKSERNRRICSWGVSDTLLVGRMPVDEFEQNSGNVLGIGVMGSVPRVVYYLKFAAAHYLIEYCCVFDVYHAVFTSPDNQGRRRYSS